MLVQQALFTSTRSRTNQGYHLAAFTDGLTEQQRQQLIKWGPSHASLADRETDAESCNFCPLEGGSYALSRTFYGGPEYSGRGGLQIVTRYLIVTAPQLALYDNDPLRLQNTARTLGCLRLLPNMTGTLPDVDLPDRPLNEKDPPTDNSVVPLHDILRILRFQKQVAVTGISDPLPTLSHILRSTPIEDRPQISFCTGLRPSIQRPFRLQFFARPDSNIFSHLTKQGIDHVAAALV